jgi:predicted hydrocarbon binding protein
LAQQEVGQSSPKQVHAYHYSPNKAVVLGSVRLKDIPGSLSRVSATIAAMGLNLVESNSFALGGSNSAEWGFFAEGEIGKVRPKDVEAAIRKSKDVIGCKIRSSEGALLVDTLHYPLTTGAGAEAMLIRKEVFLDTLKFMIKTYGSAGQALIYQFGRAAGEGDAEDLVKEMGLERVLENLPELIHLYVAQGWGKPELVDLEFSPLIATIRMHYSFECVGRSSMIPTSHFIRGHIAGLGKVFFDKSIDVTEVRCVAKGDRFCEFVAKETFLP